MTKQYTILKYRPEERSDDNLVLLFTVPKSFKVLTIRLQDELVTMWGTVELGDNTKMTTVVYEFGTGWVMDELIAKREDMQYISTVEDRQGYIWHFFRDKTTD